MSINHIRLGLNLFFMPAAFAVFAILADSAAQAMAKSAHLKPLSDLVSYGVLFLSAVAGYLTLSGFWRLWCSYQGIGENCHSCGMPTRLIDPGRYSPHYRCLACGTNRRAC